jgi:general secretion pathway protein G
MLRREKGFTLIELLIVVAIIGIIAAIAVPNLLVAIQRSKRSRTAADIRAIGTALGSYNVDFNFFPKSSGAMGTNIGLPESYYKGAVKDGWGQPIWYKVDTTGGQYTLFSYGKNMASGYTNSQFDSDIVYEDGSFVAPESLRGVASTAQ